MAGELALSEFTHGDEVAAGGTVVAAEPGPSHTACVTGRVEDTSEISIGGAVVTLTDKDSGETRKAESDGDGGFTFSHAAAGPYRLTVEMPGFQPWVTNGVVGAGETVAVPEIALAVAPVVSAVNVVATSQDVAEAQLGFEEKQRVLGVFPNFYASYVWNADPLSAKQKFSLAWRFVMDPVSIGTAATVAGGEQWRNAFPGYGQGSAGYARRLGATYADGLTSTFLGGAVLPVVFRQDPRYFVKGTGSVPSRAMYAIASAVICKGDNRRWELNYSTILGNVGAAGLSNLYYPASSRDGAALTVESSLMTTALGALGNLVQEFMLRRMTPNLPNYRALVSQ